jgi:hypothetical protein
MLPRRDSSARVCLSMKYQSLQVNDIQFRTLGLEILDKMFVRMTLGRSLMCVSEKNRLPVEVASIE